MVDIIGLVIKNVLAALYQPFTFSVLLTVSFMFLYLYAKEHGWKAVYQKWITEFKTCKDFRKVSLLCFYTVMILFKTLLNRNMWQNPVEDVIGVWGLYDKNGELTTQALENLALFIPFTILLLWSFRKQLLGEQVKLQCALWQSVKIVFLFSVTIEFLQLFLRLGTFQLSDLFQNTLGGLIGGVLYWIAYKIEKHSRSEGV